MKNFRVDVHSLLYKRKQFLGNNKHVRRASILGTSTLMFVPDLTSDAANEFFRDCTASPRKIMIFGTDFALLESAGTSPQQSY